MAAKKAKSPTLPDNAPQDVKDFVACKRLDVQLDPATVDWLPRPPDTEKDKAPTVTVSPPAVPGTPNAVSVAVGWGFLSITLPVSVADGALQIDTSNLFDIGGIKTAIEQWTKKFNDWMKANGKELSGLELRDGKIRLTKRAVGAAAPATTTPGHSSNTTKKRVAAGAALALTASAVAYGVWPDDKNPRTTAAVVTPTPDFQPTATPTPGAPSATPTPDPTPMPDLPAFPQDFWKACAPPLPCFDGQPPLVIWTGTPGITHNGSVPDPLTGRAGPSQTEWPFHIVGSIGNSTTLQVQTQCGSDTITGQAPLAPDADVSVLHPLFQYGACQPLSIQLLGGPTPVVVNGVDWPQYTVGPPEVDPPIPNFADVTVPTADALQAAATMLGILSNTALDPSCVWHQGPFDLPVTLPACANRFVFNGGNGNDQLVAHGGGYLDIPDSGDVFDTRFQCGVGDFGYTACADDMSPLNASKLAVVTVSLADIIPNDDDTSINIEMAGGNLRLIQMQQQERKDWAIEGSIPSARAILRGNSATFVFPADLAPAGSTYTITVDDIAQPPQPFMGQLTAPAADLETPEDFVAQLSESIATGNVDFALARLHPLVIEAFSDDLCRAELEGRQADDYEITVDSVGGEAPWTWQLPDGRTYDLPLATTVFLRIPGVDGIAESHLVRESGQFRWFTICDGE